jgi:BMFP domain-containing protein YqiC
MEKRLAQLEQRVAKLEGARSKPSATAKKSATKK